MLFWPFLITVMTICTLCHPVKSTSKECKTDGFSPNGPCQQNLVYCQNGVSFELNCPTSMVFNPLSNFCEQPEDFIPLDSSFSVVPFPSNPNTHEYPEESGDENPSFSVIVSPDAHVEQYPEESEVSDPSFSVIISPNAHAHVEEYPEESDESNPPFLLVPPTNLHVEKYPEESQDSDPDPSFSVIVPPNVHIEQYPKSEEFVGDDPSFSVIVYPDLYERHPEAIDDDSDSDSSYLFVPTRHDHEEEEEEKYQEDFHGGDSSSSVVVPPTQQEVNKFFNNAQSNTGYESVEQQTPGEIIDDGFLFDTVQSKESPSYESLEEQKPFFDDFKTTDHSAYRPKVSAFAPLDSPSDDGHDAFKRKSNQPQKMKSPFAPVNAAIDLGHDAFITRRKRSLHSAVVNNDDMAMCRQLHAERLTSHAFQLANSSGSPLSPAQSSSCARNKIPNGCRDFYIACVDGGQQIKRRCPAGLFFDPVRESCSQRNHIAVCQRNQPTPPAAIVFAHNQPMESNKTVQKQQMNTPQMLPPSIVQSPQQSTNDSKVPAVMHENYATIANFSNPFQPPVDPMTHTHQNNQMYHRQKSPKNKKKQQYGGQIPSQQVIKPTIYGQYSPDYFCSELTDGFYRHPMNCSRIIQCFDHQLFEYPSCQHDLAFNELKGVCDYRENVPDCSSSIQVPSSSFPSTVDNEQIHDLTNDNKEQNEQLRNTNPSPTATSNPNSSQSSQQTSTGSIGMCQGGYSHGDHIEHPDHCSAFLRCVWGRLVPMSCPRGTAFNPMLSVCDYPARVPNCQQQS